MDNIIEALRRFVERNMDKDDRDELCYLLNDVVFTYPVACDIIEHIECLELIGSERNKRIDELEDYNRLLRKENEELRNNLKEAVNSFRENYGGSR